MKSENDKTVDHSSTNCDTESLTVLVSERLYYKYVFVTSVMIIVFQALIVDLPVPTLINTFPQDTMHIQVMLFISIWYFKHFIISIYR